MVKEFHSVKIYSLFTGYDFDMYSPHNYGVDNSKGIEHLFKNGGVDVLPPTRVPNSLWDLGG